MKPGFWEKSEIFLRRLEMQMFSVTPQILFYVILFLIFNYIQPNSIWTFFEFAHLKKKKKKPQPVLSCFWVWSSSLSVTWFIKMLLKQT